MKGEETGLYVQEYLEEFFFMVAEDNNHNWELRGCPPIKKLLNKLWCGDVMAKCYEESNDFKETWKDSWEPVQSGVSRAGRALGTIPPGL